MHRRYPIIDSWTGEVPKTVYVVFRTNEAGKDEYFAMYTCGKKARTKRIDLLEQGYNGVLVKCIGHIEAGRLHIEEKASF